MEGKPWSWKEFVSTDHMAMMEKNTLHIVHKVDEYKNKTKDLGWSTAMYFLLLFAPSTSRGFCNMMNISLRVFHLQRGLFCLDHLSKNEDEHQASSNNVHKKHHSLYNSQFKTTKHTVDGKNKTL